MTAELLDPVGRGEHAVQFYDGAAGPVPTVTRFVGGGLVAGENVMVVARPEQAAAVDEALDAAGIDVDEMCANGRYHGIDAAALVPGFDLASFALTVVPLVEELAADRPLRVYGETVALLWDAGRHETALELEEFWNALMRRVPLTVLCAYAGAEREAVVATHSVVVPEPRPATRHPGRAVRRFEATARAVPLARAFVTETLLGWGLLAEPAALVVTELATNSVEHAASRLQVSVARLGDAVRIAVSDRAPGPLPEVGPPPALATGGRGLLLIESLARDWGCDPHDNGKTVWALVEAPPA